MKRGGSSTCNVRSEFRCTVGSYGRRVVRYKVQKTYRTYRPHVPPITDSPKGLYPIFYEEISGHFFDSSKLFPRNVHVSCDA